MAIIHDRDEGQEIATSLADHYTVPSSRTAIAVELVLQAYAGAANPQEVEVQFLPPSTSAANRYRVVNMTAGNALQPGEQRRYTFNPNLAAGAKIQAKTTDSASVTMHVAVVLRS
jgi:hypothetical protein